MNLSEEDLKSIMSAATEQLKTELKDSLVSKVQWQIDSTAENLIKNHVAKWMQENVIPEVTAILQDKKVGLVNAAAQAAPLMAEALSASLVAKFTSNLKGYKARDIFRHLFE